MLVNNYKLEILNNQCMPGAINVNCFAHLDRDISEVLPFLNTALCGFEYIKLPPSVTFRAQGKLIAVHSRKISINTLKDENEARKIVEWIIREINEAWDKKDDIEPSYTGIGRPSIVEILKMLPKTNCKECGSPTCMVFATLVAGGANNASGCPQISKENEESLSRYLEPFGLEDIP